jgi:hypothetical protein
MALRFILCTLEAERRRIHAPERIMAAAQFF